MKKLLTLIVVLSMNIFVFSQNVELSNRLVLQYKNYQQLSAQKSTNINHFWLTPIIKEALINWSNLTDEAKAVFQKYSVRPSFSGTEHTATLGNFVFHYTTNSSDAGENVPTTDNNSNGIPDYVDNMASVFANDVYAGYHTSLGMTVPPPDGTNGGDNKYDVYISGTEAGDWVYGYVAPESFVGNNPNSPGLTETAAYTSYMVMRNDYTGFGDVVIAMHVTAAHEYNHAVQFGYNGNMDSWFMEACATWGEDYIFPGADDNLQYLPSVFGSPDVALNYENGESGTTFDDHWYGTWIFMKFVSEHTNNNIVKNIYERTISTTTINAIENELSTNWSSNLTTMFGNWVIANNIMTSDATNYPLFSYSRASVYNTYILSNGGYKVEKALSYSGTDVTFSSQSQGNNRLMRLSYDRLTLTANQNFKITFTSATPTSQTYIVLIKKNGSNYSFQTPTISGNSYILNVTDYTAGTTYIPVVFRIDKTVTNTTAVNYTINISAATLDLNDQSVKFAVYPNPASDYIVVDAQGNSNVYIRNTLGQVLINQNISENNKIDVQNLPNGLYFVDLIDENNVVKTNKIVILR